jgi:ATP-dependent Clp protease ATP-binding subunit ClpC
VQALSRTNRTVEIYLKTDSTHVRCGDRQVPGDHYLMPRPNENIVLKYCELLDEFIRIKRTHDDELLTGMDPALVTSRNSYHQLVVDRCVVDFESQVRPLFERHNKVYQAEALIELLYQICIEVNPQFEIHNVTLPTDGSELLDDDTPDTELDEGYMSPEQMRDFQERAADIESVLSARVVGQERAVAAISHAVKKAAVGLKNPNKPIGSFLLVGPTGTGKTELAKALTRQLFGSLQSLVRIDCSEYALPHEYAKLIGAPPGYIGHNEGGQLTEAVKKASCCVVLFDEIEKAHEKVHNLLLQIMDEGALTDSKGETISFKRCVVILTSNIGMEDVQSMASRVGFGKKGQAELSTDQVEYTMEQAVKASFKPEFINRIDQVVQFRALTVSDCRSIAAIQLEEMAGYLDRTGVALRFTPGLRRHLAAKGWSAEYGARELRRFIRDLVEQPLTEHLMAHDFTSGDTVTIGVRGKGKITMSRQTTTTREPSNAPCEQPSAPGHNAA